MTCPACGALMNRHAEKLVLPRSEAEAAAHDRGLDGALLEEHTCPACGAQVERLVGPPPGN